MSRWIVLACALVGCGSPPAPPVAKPEPPPPPFFTLGVDSIGPIHGKTPANLTAIRELLGKDGYTVRPINDGGVELHVYDGKEHLFYVIPNDDGSLFNVHVVSSSIAISEHPEWVVGKPLVHANLLTFCEPWGPHPVCWKQGDHVALGFERDSDGLDTAVERGALEGTKIQRAVWSPTPFGVDKDDDDGGGTSEDVPEWIPHADP